MEIKVDAKQLEPSSAYFSYAHLNGWESRKGYIGPGRVVGVGEHLLRIFGFKRGQSLYGPEGDRLAGRYNGNGKDWTRGADCCDWEPAFLSKSKTNQVFAYMIFIALLMGGFLAFLRFSTHQMSAQQPTTAAVADTPTIQPQAVAQLPPLSCAVPPAAGQFATMAAYAMPNNGTPVYAMHSNATPASGMLAYATPPIATVRPVTVLAGTPDAPRAKTFINR